MENPTNLPGAQGFTLSADRTKKELKTLISSEKENDPLCSVQNLVRLPNKGTFEFLELIKKGADPDVLVFLAGELEVSKEAMAFLIGTNIRTINRRKANEKPLDPNVSERTLHIKSIHNELTDYFQDHDKANRWLKKPKPVFQNKAPIDLLNTLTGIEIVFDVINRMNHGFPA